MRHSRPVISDGELRGRVKALSDALAEAGFDGWIAYGDDRAVYGPDHIRYLADIEPHFEPVLLAGTTDASTALLLTGPETVGYAAVRTARAAVSEIVAMEELAHPEEEYPTISFVRGHDVLGDLFAGCRRIALVGTDAMSHVVWELLIAPLETDGRSLTFADPVAYRLRSLKTADEQAVIGEAYRIARAGLEAAVAALVPGVSEREIAAEAEVAMRRAGAEGFGIDTMVASGFEHSSPILARTTAREIRSEDLVCVTLAPRYEGYHAALARPFLFSANAVIEDAIEVARHSQRAAVEQLFAGRRGSIAADAVRQVVDASRTGAELPYVPIHSIGVVEFEPPIFLSSSEVEIADGMALSIDAALFHAPWGGLRLEDGFSIQSGRAVPRFDDYERLVPVMLS